VRRRVLVLILVAELARNRTLTLKIGIGNVPCAAPGAGSRPALRFAHTLPLPAARGAFLPRLAKRVFVAAIIQAGSRIRLHGVLSEIYIASFL